MKDTKSMTPPNGGQSVVEAMHDTCHKPTPNMLEGEDLRSTKAGLKKAKY